MSKVQVKILQSNNSNAHSFSLHLTHVWIPPRRIYSTCHGLMLDGNCFGISAGYTESRVLVGQHHPSDDCLYDLHVGVTCFARSLFPSDASTFNWIWLSISGIVGFVFGDYFCLNLTSTLAPEYPCWSFHSAHHLLPSSAGLLLGNPWVYSLF